MRIAFVHNSFPGGGAERITMDIARYLKPFDAYDIYVYATHIGAVPSDVQDCLTVRKIPSQAVQSKRSKAMENLIGKDRIDILVEVTKSVYDIDGIRSRTGVKTILACHGEVFWQRYVIMHRRQKKKLLWNLFYKKKYADGSLALEKAQSRTRFDYDHCDAYTVLCQEYKNQLERSLGIEPGKSKVVVIENPEKVVEAPNLDKENEILFCGRFENWSKRIDRLLRIWAKVQDELPSWRLTLVGDGPAMAYLKDLACRLALERVSFEGSQANVAPYYDRASVVCLTSQTEGWPLALTEAQARGCIGVAFASTAGIREILSPYGKCGFPVEPFSEDEFAAVLLRIASSREEDLRRIRLQGIEKRRKYSPSLISHRWKELFDALIYDNI